MEKESLQMYVWKALDILRGATDPSQSRNILALYFLHRYAETAPHLEVPAEAELETVIGSSLYNPNSWEEALWQVVRRNDGIEALPGMEEVVETLYPRGLDHRVLTKLLVHLSEVTLPLEQIGQLFDEMNARVEQSIGRFGGDWSTPVSVNELGIRILQPASGTFCDSSAGMGFTMLAAWKYAREQGKDLAVHGEEVNKTAWALGRIHLTLYGVQDAEFVRTDSLVHPAFLGSKKFDYVMMDVPYGLKLDEEKYEALHRDVYGRTNYGIPPRSSADMAFVLHALTSLNHTGKAVIVLPKGPLFRGAAEANIRKALLQADVVEAVISLPEQLHLATAIPVNLLVLNRNKAPERKGKVLFINADKKFKQVDRRTRQLEPEHIEEILQVFREGLEIEQFSTLVDVRDIQDGNLLSSTYLKLAKQYIEGIGTVQVDQEAFARKADTQPLQAVAKLYRGINVLPREIEEGEGEYSIIRVSDVQEGELQIHQLQPCRILNNARTDAYLVQEGDVIISSRGANVKIAVIPPHDGKLLLSQNFIGIRPSRQLNPYFLKAYIESPVGQFLLASMQVGTAISTISPKSLGELSVPMLSWDTQQEIGKHAREAEEQYRRVLQEAQENRKEALQQMYRQMGIDEVYTIDR